MYEPMTFGVSGLKPRTSLPRLQVKSKYAIYIKLQPLTYALMKSSPVLELSQKTNIAILLTLLNVERSTNLRICAADHHARFIFNLLHNIGGCGTMDTQNL